MIVEGYTLDLYCDGKHQPWELSVFSATGGFLTSAAATYGGRNRREAWKEAKRAGWLRKGKRVFCPGCARGSV